MVLHPTSLCPPYFTTPSTQPFQHLFGIEFIVNDAGHVRPFSSFEFATCFSLGNELTYSLSRPGFTACMDAGIPGITSAWVFDQIHDKLCDIHDSNTKVFDPSPQPTSSFVSVLSQHSVSVRMPTTRRWIECTASDAELKLVKSMIIDPALITKVNLAQINYNYRSPLRRYQLTLEDGIIIFKEPIIGRSSYTHLCVVPTDLRNIFL
jgi:hypothetical protein